MPQLIMATDAQGAVGWSCQFFGPGERAVAPVLSVCCGLRFGRLPPPPSAAAPTPMTAVAVAPSPMIVAATAPSPMAPPPDWRDMIGSGRKVVDNRTVGWGGRHS